ncbi:hypothetical protein [Streptosporangium lutulentum]|uniref:Uncharacterized protein n=1 Tax=Streptosporangium lutulentum TaxID=1461250 RepID=A0ABT9QUA8_9ACTN|nr:hypothetical protein [Streptosporangium lutulentum]MDP9850358.1 hypothetical protein [Streptosporangium lutulentum]
MEIGDEGFRLSAEVALTLHQLLMSLWRKLFPPTDIMIDPKEDRVLHVEVDRAGLELDLYVGGEPSSGVTIPHNRIMEVAAALALTLPS